MDTISDLMKDLDGADPETVNRIAWEKGSLPVRLAMLGLASIRKGQRPLWWGYPPGVFISYKWEGGPMRDLVTDLANHVRELGYRAFLDEYQHAVRPANRGRLIVVPVLLEPNGTTDDFTLDKVINLTDDHRAFGALNDILRPHPGVLDDSQSDELSTTVEEFDTLFLDERWAESDNVLRRADHLRHTFDHQFRCMLHSIYTADEANFDAALARLYPVYGQQIVWHLYKGYCTVHGIPNRAIVE